MRITKYKTIKPESGYGISLIKECAVNCPDKKNMTNPWDVADMMNTVFQSYRQTEEYMHMLCFNTRMDLIGVFEISHGTVNSSVADTREVFQKALLCNAVNIILVHNHPSGIATPSDTDITFTKKIMECSKLINIPLQDHIIIGERDYYSMREGGVIS